MTVSACKINNLTATQVGTLHLKSKNWVRVEIWGFRGEKSEV